MLSDEITSYAAFESRYRDRFYIGSGGFAKVYKVFDHAKNHFVALKMADVRPEWKQFTLKREVELVNGLPPHRNIARYENCYRFNTGITGQVDFAILKFYEYGNLEQFLVKQAALTLEDKRVIIRGILDGISFLHDNDIIHRDLKAQNILMHREDGVWTPKITDFGLSRQAIGNATITNSAVGLSYAYAAPEQIQNHKIYKNVDIWAAGVIIYRIIAGEIPFQSDRGIDSRSTQSQLQISQKIINLELPEKLHSLEEPFRTMVQKCLVLDPLARAQSAKELIAILNEAEPAVQMEPSFRPVMPEEEEEEATKMIKPSSGNQGWPNVPPQQPEPVGETWSPESFAPPAYVPATSPNYVEPRQNVTQFIPPVKEEEPVSKAPIWQGKTDDGGNILFNWWVIIIPILLVALAVGVYWIVQERTQNQGNIDWDNVYEVEGNKENEQPAQESLDSLKGINGE